MNTPAESPTPPLAATHAIDRARERAIAILTDRYADGAFDDAALEVHLARLHAATDLAGVESIALAIQNATPVQPAAVAMVPAPSVSQSVELPVFAPRRVLAIMSETRRTGRWIVPAELRVVAVMSDVKLDFRRAVLPPLSVVDVTCFMAAVHIVVPPGVPVAFEADGVMGTAKSSAIEPELGDVGPVIRIVGSAFMGEISVVVKEPKAR